MTDARRTIIPVLALIMGAALLPAHAVRFEIGAGYSVGKPIANGSWRQQGNPYTMHTNGLTWYAGVSGHPWRYLTWHADYVNLGRYSENSWDTTDQAYGAGCRGPNCGWWGQFVGSGSDQGIRVTAGPRFGGRHWGVSLQAGPYFYLSTWSVTIYPSTGGQFAATHMNRVQVGDVVDVTARYREFTLTLSRYLMRAPWDRYPPLIYGATTITAGMSFGG